MTTAILSFTIAGRMTFRCDSLRIDERRDLEPDPPFASWAQRYATANASRELLLDLGHRFQLRASPSWSSYVPDSATA